MSKAVKKPAQGQTPERDYEVGYCKPPRHSQFKKGKSGNPRGIREPRTLPETARDQLHQTMTVTANGKRKRIFRQDAVMMAMVRNAIEGSEKSAKILLDMMDRLPPPSNGPTHEEYQQINGGGAFSIAFRGPRGYRAFQQASYRSSRGTLEEVVRSRVRDPVRQASTQACRTGPGQNGNQIGSDLAACAASPFLRGRSTRRSCSSRPGSGDRAGADGELQAFLPQTRPHACVTKSHNADATLVWGTQGSGHVPRPGTAPAVLPRLAAWRRFRPVRFVASPHEAGSPQHIPKINSVLLRIDHPLPFSV